MCCEYSKEPSHQGGPLEHTEQEHLMVLTRNSLAETALLRSKADDYNLIFFVPNSMLNLNFSRK